MVWNDKCDFRYKTPCIKKSQDASAKKEIPLPFWSMFKSEFKFATCVNQDCKWLVFLYLFHESDSFIGAVPKWTIAGESSCEGFMIPSRLGSCERKTVCEMQTMLYKWTKRAYKACDSTTIAVVVPGGSEHVVLSSTSAGVLTNHLN